MDAQRFSFMSAGASRSISNIMASHQVRREYPTSADAYELLEEAGRGVSATVWSAICKPFNEPVAIKLMDLENMNCSLDEIVREAQTMRSLNHPCLLPLLASFVHRENLWMVMPYVSGGSVLNIMRFAYPDGLEEPVIATIMRDVLRGLEYLHRRGIIHRDVKAGNILLDAGGHVLLADFGVATTLERGGSWGNLVLARNTFVGTPCWMAPEVMEQTQGYDERADIWSFGITLLEMAHGHAPFARLPPMKVLLMTLQNPPPTLDSEPTKKPYSKAMRELVAKCLVKDPARRPSASSLLEHKFFKTAHDSSYLQRHLLAGLPSVPERVQLMKAGHGTRPDVDREVLASQEEYRKGVSSWNFDVAALKAAAAAGRDGEERLAPISEASEAALGADLGADASVPGVLASAHRSGVAGALAPSAGSTAASAARGSGLIKEQGRFRVYEGGEAPPFDGGRANGGDEPGGSRAAGVLAGPAPLGGADEGAAELDVAEKAKRKGRFRYIEDDAGATTGTRGGVLKTVSGVPSDARSATSAASPTGPPAAQLLAPLSDVLEGLRLQAEVMRELVAALGDAERGRLAALNGFLAERAGGRGPVGVPEAERLRAEAAELREENDRLRERVRALEAHRGGGGEAGG